MSPVARALSRGEIRRTLKAIDGMGKARMLLSHMRILWSE